MTNHVETQVRLRDAERQLNASRTLVAAQEWSNAVLLGQLCVEQSAKAVIACFENPEHEHVPGAQLLSIVAENLTDIVSRCGEEMTNRLRRLALEADRIALWHITAAYGQQLPDNTRLAAVDSVGEDDARWAVALAERCFATARNFVQAWLAAGGG